MQNKNIAINNIILLQERRKTLAATAEYIMSVDSFTSREISEIFNISQKTALSRLEGLKQIGFIFKKIHRGRNSGIRYRLVDCTRWENAHGKKNTIKSDIFHYVEKAVINTPQIPNLWKIALGIEGLSEKIGHQLKE